MGLLDAPPVAKPKGNRTIGYGDSLTIGLGSDSVMTGGSTVLGCLSFFHQACLISAGRIQFYGNHGVVGETTAQILVRIGNVLAAKPDMVMYLGGRNDIDNGVALATTQANIRTTITQLQAAGIRVVILAVPPTNSTPVATATLNRWLRRYAASKGCAFADIHAALISPTTGNYQIGYSTDGKHPTAAGARVGGQRIVTEVLSAFPPIKPLLADADNAYTPNLLVDGLFLADGDSDGVANNWSKTVGGAAFSLVSDANIVGNYQKTNKTTTGASNVFQTVSTGFSVGDTLAFGYKIRATVEAGGMNINARLNFNGSTGPARCGLTGWASDLPDGSAFYAETVVPASTTTLGIEFGTSSPGTGTLEQAQATLVNLTTGAILTL